MPGYSNNFGSFALRAINQLVSGLDHFAVSSGTREVTPVFVIGLPRSGTTLVYELLVQAFDTAFLSRLYNYTFGLPNITARLTKNLSVDPAPKYESYYGRIPGILSPAENYSLWKKWFPTHPVLGHYVPVGAVNEKMKVELNRLIGSMTEISGKQYVFKNVYSSLFFNLLMKVFPGARTVLVRRDLESVAASVLKRRSEYGGTSRWWSVMPPFTRDIVGKSLLEQVAFQCVRTEQLIERHLNDCAPGRCFTVQYAEVCKSPISVVNDLADWLGPSIKRRTKSVIPRHFDYRMSRDFLERMNGRFTDLVESLRASEGCYFELISREERRY